MSSGLSFQYPVWFIVLCIALGALYAAVLYYRDRTFDDKLAAMQYWKTAMAVFRFAAVTILAILLLSPLLRSRNTQEFKPIVAIVHDNSESMRLSLGKDTTLYKQQTEALIKKLSSKYDVEEYAAGDGLRKGMEFSFTDKSSGLSSAIEELSGIYYNRNLGAVVLLSDGIYNRGVNPVYSAETAPYSIYTIAVGDTSVQRDQKLAGAYHNKIAYLNDRFCLRVDVEANNFLGKNAKLNVYEINAGIEPKLLQQKDISYASDNFFQSYDFVLDADRVGIAHYRITLTNLPEEATYKNNVRDIFVEVMDGRQKILLIANSPHPDVAAFKAAIESNKNYQLDVEFAESFSRKLNDYNLVILHQLPSASQRLQNVLTDATNLKKPLLYVLGTQTLLTDFNKVQDGVNVRSNAAQFNDVTASVNKDFSLFTLSDRTLQTIPKFPPLHNFFGEYAANPAAKILLNQKINSVVTDFPLWLMNDAGEVKTGVIAGEGLWRWRLYDYQLNKSHDATNELINKTVQFLSVKADKRPFRVNLSKNIFQDNEAVTFDAQLYNANYELINSPDVDLKISGEDHKIYEYKFNRTEKAYELNAGFLPVGSYTYTASAKFGNNTLTASGKFSVSPLQLEEMNTRADYRVLYQLATQHKGNMYALADALTVADDIEANNQLKPVLYDMFRTESAINLKWIFFLLLILISLEWGLRKYLGGY
ncbi:MAG: hypothetical protein KIS94_03390 [Chitinophagales bacterium]|nr:hypothetical protein [Chitinophagales bacterium]